MRSAAPRPHIRSSCTVHRDRRRGGRECDRTRRSPSLSACSNVKFKSAHPTLNIQLSPPRFASLAAVLLAAACIHQQARDLERFDEPGEAAADYAMKRVVIGHGTPRERYAAAREQMRHMSQPVALTESAGSAQIGSWKFLGPGNIGGRMRALLIADRNPST